MTTTTQIMSESPDIEAYKLGLLESAKGLADQPVGLGMVDAQGNPIMEDYTYTDDEGKEQTGQRQVKQLPTMQVAGMSPLQQQALYGAQQGIGNYMPYLQQAGYTMGDAQQISIFKFFFVVVWTYVLNMICKAGYTNISWFFVLLPFIIMFGMIITLALSCGA